MVDIFSKKEGPRREDVVAKRLISENRQTIHRLADQISGGGYSASRKAAAKAKEPPKPEGLNIHLLGGSAPASPPDPRVRISLNKRVVVMDANSGRQMQFLGQMRVRDGQTYFALATRTNGFVSPVDDETERQLADLNGVVIESSEIEEKFVGVIRERLNF